MLELCFPLEQIERVLNLSSDSLRSLLTHCGVTDREGLISKNDAERVMEYLRRENDSRRQRAEDKLRRLAAEKLMMIDTCALLLYFDRLWKNLRPILLQCGKQLVVPSAVVKELQSLANRGKCREEAARAGAILSQGVKDGLIRIFGEPADCFGDRHFLRKAIELRENHALLVITRDKGLAEDLLRLNETSSVRGQRITVCQVNQYGYLSYIQPQASRSGSSADKAPVRTSVALIPEERTPLTPAFIPEKGGGVMTRDGRRLILGDRIGSGGEGTVYSLADGTAAKIYRKDKLTAGKRAKLEAMVAMDVDIPGVCWPKEPLYDGDGCFLGYRMDRAEGEPLETSVFRRDQLEKLFPDWTRTELVRLSVTILEKISALHRQGVLLGDVNGQNILVASPEEVWLVDCDSFQVGGYPCPVGTNRFTPPELQGMRFDSFLRTEDNERFSVAMLLFMLMLPGKSPYAQQGSGDLCEAIRRMDFPYPLGEQRGKCIPAGDWRYLWSHLPRFVKEAFYNTFQKGERHSRPEDRLTVNDWLSRFRHYLDLLESGKYQSQDPQSALIFPNRNKMYEGGGRIAGTYVCVECGASFDLMEGEVQYFKARAMPLPKRCPTCRNLRKLLRQAG